MPRSLPVTVLVFATLLLAQLPLHGGWLLHPDSAILANPFQGTHVWAADVVGQAWWRGEWPDPTREAGFPLIWRARYVAWAVLIVAAALRPLASPVLVVNLATLLGPALGGVAMVGLARRMVPEASRGGLLMAGVAYGLAPVTLGAALSGQLENTQSWVLPVLLQVAAWAASTDLLRVRLWRAGLTALVWAIGAATSPYLAMLAAIAAPWLAWRVGLRRALLPLALGGLALLGVAAWLDPGGFDPATSLFRPSWTRVGEWPPLWTNPLAVADLDTLLTGVSTLQPRAMVLHQPYLGLALLGAALGLGRHRARWSYPAVVGVLLALGPILGWHERPLTVAGARLVLPAMSARWLHLPLASGGQYYRCILLAHLGLAGMLAASRRPRWGAFAMVVMIADSIRVVAMPGLPWPVFDLPTSVWQEWAQDPEPGAVVNLPLFSPFLVPCHPERLAGHAFHGRPLAALPRAYNHAPDTDLLQVLERCGQRGQGCALPSEAEMAKSGFRYGVIDLPDVPERRMIRRRLTRIWGPPDGEASGLLWWVLEGSAPSSDPDHDLDP